MPIYRSQPEGKTNLPVVRVISEIFGVHEHIAITRGFAKLAITGFCWGGRITWLYFAHNPKVKAAAAWYGGLAGERNELMPKQPVDIAPTLKVPVLGLYGGKYQGDYPGSRSADERSAGQG